MTVELIISVISLGLSGTALYLVLSTRWGKNPATGPLPRSTSKEPKEAELESGMEEWPQWSWKDHFELMRQPKEAGRLPGDPTFNVKADG